MSKRIKKFVTDQKEQLIQHLLQLGAYKSSDGRQLYELALDELKMEYQKQQIRT
ncbi:Fur-regulated basic protein FbpA [Bacillus sp. FJAT-45037]|uniref:Fur-regulated basic protein FbpA n=1 Tax=Bacillus sp. FJAT-45037 TaxID=2011007 RepID=UPI001E56437A|nr:Fur-regulated basic protein FbpA [Bacillus sp. FJAT-45037]